jgi:hypothetical protein
LIRQHDLAHFLAGAFALAEDVRELVLLQGSDRRGAEHAADGSWP